MPNSDNLPQLPKNQSAISTNGVVSRDWYRFFLNLLNKVNEGGGGGNGTGTVTSVNVSGGVTGLTTSGGPITTNGTITLNGTVNVANGGTGATTASGARTNLGLIIGTDIPGPTGAGASGTWNISVTGNAANLSATLAVGKGGTGTTTLATNNVLLGNGAAALQTVAPSTSGNVLQSNGSTWISSSLPLTTDQVLNATAGASVGAVGTYAFLVRNLDVTSLAAGSTWAGSNLVYGSVISQNFYNYNTAVDGGSTTSPLGTWRLMGEFFRGASDGTKASLWLRIS